MPLAARKHTTGGMGGGVGVSGKLSPQAKLRGEEAAQRTTPCRLPSYTYFYHGACYLHHAPHKTDAAA
jgi:hypothetical protein